MRKFFAAVCVATVGTLLPGTAHAATITASEVLEDALQFDLLTSNLSRSRTDASGTTTDTPDAGNAISSNFGIWTGSDISWTHDLSWLPSGITFLSARLEIRAWGVDNQNDSIRADNQFIGYLTPELLSGVGLIDFGFSTTISSSPFLVSGLQSDGRLTLTVDPHGTFLNPEALSVYYSRLEVTYDDGLDAAAVPEPASLFLLGSGIASVVAQRRRRRR